MIDPKDMIPYSELAAMPRTTIGFEANWHYLTWLGWRGGCTDREHWLWRDFGAKGIKMHQPWIEDYENFLRDMAPKPGREFKICRCDRKGDIDLQNVGWMHPDDDIKEGKADYFKEPVFNMWKTLHQWAEFTGTDYETVKRRHFRGWPIDEIIFGRGGGKHLIGPAHDH